MHVVYVICVNKILAILKSLAAVPVEPFPSYSFLYLSFATFIVRENVIEHGGVVQKRATYGNFCYWRFCVSHIGSYGRGICQNSVVADAVSLPDPRNQRVFEPFIKDPRTMDCKIHGHLHHIPLLGRD